MEKSTVSRRGFLRLSVAAAGMAATGTGFQAIATAQPTPAAIYEGTHQASAMLRVIAAGLGVPYQVLAGQFAASYSPAFSYSAYREALLSRQTQLIHCDRNLDGDTE